MSNEIKEALKKEALSLGFDSVGVASVDVNLRSDYYVNWISGGMHGDMRYLERFNEKRLDPKKILPEAASILCFGMNYYQEGSKRRGIIAKYALGKDYHNLIFKKLKKLCSVLREHGGEQKPYVDTGPVLEKGIAASAGLGWQGKSTILINRPYGTWLFLGVIVTTLKLEPDAPEKDRCGSCTRCIDVCPTKAIVAPYQLDATRCISYLTIEHKGPIPLQFRRLIGDRLYGCDDCLDVCPWNRWAQTTKETFFTARQYPDLRVMLEWGEDDFSSFFQGTPIKRLGLERWLRNVCVVLGNIGTQEDEKFLKHMLCSESLLVSEHAEWALEEIRNRFH